MESNQLKAIGYVRVSTEEQAREGISLEAQEERIRAFAKAKAWILDEIIIDRGCTGKNLKRAGIGNLISKIDAKDINIVIKGQRDIVKILYKLRPLMSIKGH